MKMRNIVLITLDSLRADHCSFMGYKRKTTPTLDKMAKMGLTFENAIASGTRTPVSMTGIFTGDYALTDAGETRPEPWKREIARRKTLAQVLSKNGYSTGAIHPNVFASSYYGFDKGFDYFQDFLTSDNKRIMSKLTNRFGIFRSRKMANLRYLACLVQKEEFFKPWENYYDYIIKWVEQTKKPFFLWILLLDTHMPYYTSPKKFRERSFLDFDLIYFDWSVRKANWRLNLSDKKRMKVVDAYDDSIFYADSFIKRLFGDLKKEDPIFIVHADHGDGFEEHGFYDHPPYLYEELVHVPLVIYNAGTKGRVEKPISLVGLAPTILDLVDAKNEFLFESFLNGGEEWVISKVFLSGKRKIAVRMKHWKFITGQKEIDELYNLKQDPNEQENLINEHLKLAEEMRKITKNHIAHEVEMRRIQNRAMKEGVTLAKLSGKTIVK